MIRPYILDLPKGRAWAAFPPFFLEIHTGNLSKFSPVVGTRRPRRLPVSQVGRTIETFPGAQLGGPALAA